MPKRLFGCAIFAFFWACAALSAEAPIPDALAVSWRGKPLCEKLYEDSEIRVAKCIFPPGAVHERHTHPAYLSYVLTGGSGEIVDAKGKRSVETRPGQLIDSQAVPWHQFSNVGDSTISYLLVERKYASPPK